MLRTSIQYAVVVAVAAVLWAPDSSARAADEPAAEGVLLLHSGGVLCGQITQTGDRYLVRGAKSHVDVAASQVMLVCNSLADAYEQQRRQPARQTVESHLTLAEWCLRYNLFDEATRELTEARRIDAHHPRLELLERRLAVIREPRAAVPAVAEDDANGAKQVEELRALDAMAAELPAGTVERFTRKVQPMLVNTCTTAGCHQPTSKQEFQLDRAMLHGLSNRRTTLRNLSATLALVDRSAPQQSRLLTIPLDPHGGRKSPLLGTRQEEHLQMLAEWVALATGTALPTVQVAAVPEEVPQPLANKMPRGSHAAVMPTPAEQMIADQEEAALFDGMAPPRIGAEGKSWQPKDEFDPEIFNRRTVQPASTNEPLP